jgi:hypothetical protein
MWSFSKESLHSRTRPSLRGMTRTWPPPRGATSHRPRLRPGCLRWRSPGERSWRSGTCSMHPARPSRQRVTTMRLVLPSAPALEVRLIRTSRWPARVACHPSWHPNTGGGRKVKLPARSRAARPSAAEPPCRVVDLVGAGWPPSGRGRRAGGDGPLARHIPAQGSGVCMPRASPGARSRGKRTGRYPTRAEQGTGNGFEARGDSWREASAVGSGAEAVGSGGGPWIRGSAMRDSGMRGPRRYREREGGPAARGPETRPAGPARTGCVAPGYEA